jgi:hypothetical protein
MSPMTDVVVSCRASPARQFGWRRLGTHSRGRRVPKRSVAKVDDPSRRAGQNSRRERNKFGCGAGNAVGGWTSADPGLVWRRAASTDSQNRCGSPSPRPTDTQAAQPAWSAWPIQERNNTVLPLPAEADTMAMRPVASRSNSRGRETITRAPGRATSLATAPDPATDPTTPNHR